MPAAPIPFRPCPMSMDGASHGNHELCVDWLVPPPAQPSLLSLSLSAWSAPCRDRSRTSCSSDSAASAAPTVGRYSPSMRLYHST
eukprot:356064-Chlamydomonas_euryale.AAC.12